MPTENLSEVADEQNNGAETFASLIRRYRLASGLSQEALAERAGLHAETVSTLERGLSRAPQRQTVQRLTKALGLRSEEHDALNTAIIRRRGARGTVGRGTVEPGPGGVPRRSLTLVRGTAGASLLHHNERVPQLLGALEATDDNPPVQRVGIERDNLPRPLTRLVGREQDLAEAGQLLAQTRLLTLTGTAGTGKTRLAIELATQVRANFADGAMFVPLAAISDPSLVGGAIAATLDIVPGVSQSTTVALINWLQLRSVLLVLDNFEQVVDAAPLVADLLAGCAGLTILVTSRMPLHLSGEQEYAVSPLALPTRDGIDTNEVAWVGQSPAVALFIQRAQSINPKFALSADNAATVAAICRQVNGLPLALELAAARTKLFSPQALLARLSNRLGVLTSGPRDLPARQQTLRDAIAWSYDLLTAAEQRLFRRLGVFVGGWTLEAAEAVCADQASGETVVATLGSLLDKSLVHAQMYGSGDDRYGMLETIREYAVECLIQSGESELVHGRHAAFYAALPGPLPDVAWLAVVVREYANLSAALHWAHDTEAIAPELDLVISLSYPWNSRRDLREARTILQNARGLEEQYWPLVSVRQRAVALSNLGFVLWRLDSADERVEGLLHESLALSRRIGLAFGVGDSLRHLGMVAHERGEYQRATAFFEEYLAISQASAAQTIGRAHGVARQDVAWALTKLAGVALSQGAIMQAMTLAEQSLIVSRAYKDMSCVADSLNIVGVACWLAGDVERASVYFSESLDLQRQLEAYMAVATVLCNMGRLAITQGQPIQARAMFVESITMARLSGPLWVVADNLEELAGLAIKQGKIDIAVRLLGVAQAIRETKRLPRWPIYQAQYEHACWEARVLLGEDAFATTLSAVQTLVLSDAIDASLLWIRE